MQKIKGYIQWHKMKKIKRTTYLDYAAATPLDADVLKKMHPFFYEEFGNPYSIHTMGMRAREAILDARKKIAMVLGAKPNTIFFTSGGTESNNLAILGVARAVLNDRKIKEPNIITTQFEHSSVREPLEILKKEGFSITHIPVNKDGVLDIEFLRKNLRPETVLMSIMYVNNEIGTIQPIKEIGSIIKKWRAKNKTAYPYFHTDASQAPRYLPILVNGLGVDLLTIDGAKIYGPKGVGALYKKEGVPLSPFMWGGKQENGLRPGTENVYGIVGLGHSFSQCLKRRKKDETKLIALRKYFIYEIQKAIPCAEVNGGKKTVSGIINIMFRGHDGERILTAFEDRGIYVTTSSACSTGRHGVSHVLRSLGRSVLEAKSSIRFSLGRETQKEDILFTVNALKEILN